MRKKRNNILLLGLIVFILLVNFYLKPYLLQREVTRVSETVLTFLKSNDIDRTYFYWKNPYKAPPMYELMSYDITKKIFDSQDGRPHAKIFVVLKFSKNNVLPSGREWLMELKDLPRIGWKIIDFRLADQGATH